MRSTAPAAASAKFDSPRSVPAGEKRITPMALAPLSDIQRIVFPAPSSVTAISSGPREGGLGMSWAGNPPAPAQMGTALQDDIGITLIPAPAGVAVAGSMRAMALPSTNDTHTMPLGSIWTS